MKVGVLCGDRWHPAEIVLTGLREALGERETGDLPEANGQSGRSGERIALEPLPPGAELSRSWLADKDVVVLAKLNHVSEEDSAPWLTAEIKAAIMAYVEEGGGLAVIHAGTAGFKDDPVFCRFIGGVFAYHPESCPVTLALNAGKLPFRARNEGDIVVFDEHYMMDMADESLDVFLTAASEHGMQAAGWSRSHGQGKLFTLTPGHYLEVWREPVFRHLIAGGVRWCAGKAGGIDSAGGEITE